MVGEAMEEEEEEEEEEVILYILYSLKRYLNIFLVLNIES
jgi:hypothetical protein